MIMAPRVIAVDDNPEHLEKLEQGFESLGGYCLGIDHDEVAERLRPFESGVRLVFMDINLMPGAGNDRGARTFEPIANAIQKLVCRDNGPYALVTWTNTPDSHAALMSYLEESDHGALQPCADFCLAKEEYLEGSTQTCDTAEGPGERVSRLRFAVELGKWQFQVQLIDRCRQFMTFLGAHGRQTDGKVANIAVNVGAAAAGGELGRTQPFHSFSQGMSSVLSDRLDHEAPEAKVEGSWAKRLQGSQRVLEDPEQKAKLNSFFNVAEVSPKTVSSSGMVYRVLVKDILPFLRPRFEVRQGSYSWWGIRSHESWASGRTQID